MKKYSAVVRNKNTKEVYIIESEYNSKKEFKEDLKMNGLELVGNDIKIIQ